ncbi:hypothetical protein J6590_070795 [Homalodisca vitripennis]|nr:hypothetical protein J6590_070795 [Homalodisca vitripennis]
MAASQGIWCRRPKRARTHPRSRSLQRDMSLSSSYICPCCFLNRISFLRQAPRIPGKIAKSVSNNQIGVNPREETKDMSSNHIYSDVSTALTDYSLGSYKVSRNFSDNGEEFMFPERLISPNIQKSDSTFIVDAVLENTSLFDLPGTQHASRTDESTYQTETLASEIDLMLQEQRKFVKKFDLPISDDGRFKLNANVMCSQGDFLTQELTTGKEKNRQKDSSIKKLKICKTAKEKASYLASGDQDGVIQTNDAIGPEVVLNLSRKDENKLKTKSNKPSFHFNEEPVKLPKTFELTFSTDIDADINKDTFTDKNISVKMLFFPQNRLNCSSSSFDTHGDKSATDSLVYVTAANSLADLVRGSEMSQAVYTLADSNSTISLCKTTSESTNLLEFN